jgi:prepilin signal peptidase PulO-like enzyme (type II secretory pathway)
VQRWTCKACGRAIRFRTLHSLLYWNWRDASQCTKRPFVLLPFLILVTVAAFALAVVAFANGNQGGAFAALIVILIAAGYARHVIAR